MQDRPGLRMKEDYRSPGVHRDSAWQGFGSLGQVQAQDTVFKLGFNLVLIDDLGKVKLTLIFSDFEFDPYI